VAMHNTTTAVEVGRGKTDYTDGQISGLKIYNRVLSADEIELLYDREKGGY